VQVIYRQQPKVSGPESLRLAPGFCSRWNSFHNSGRSFCVWRAGTGSIL
jgi:hypothetical protein